MRRKTILLFHPRTFHERNYRYFHIPYSLLSVAASVDRVEYDVVLVDNNVEAKDDFNSLLEDLEDSLVCVGISAMIGHQIADGLAFARQVRRLRRPVPIIWGGALPTVLPDLTISHDLVDIIVRRQGQETFPETVAAIGSGDLKQVRGISFKRAGRVVVNPDRPFADFGRFPLFASTYNLVDVGNYVRSDEHINSRTISYHSSQGCPFNCGFCSEVALWSRTWGGFTAPRILEDVQNLVDTYGVNGIKFYDAEFFIKQDRVLAFAKGVVDRGLDLRWAAAVHPRNFERLTEDQTALLAASGASRLLMGAESGVDAELELIGKRTTRELLMNIAKRCSRHDITASFSFVTGYPGMPAENIGRTLEFATELAAVDNRHEAKVHFYAPYPGTPLYDRALDHGFVPPATLEGWSTYDYYEVTTPWVDAAWERPVRAFNEKQYPYISPDVTAGQGEAPLNLNPLL